MSLKSKTRRTTSRYYSAAFDKQPRKLKKYHKQKIFTLVSDLKKAGIWDKTVAMYPFHQYSKSINIKDYDGVIQDVITTPILSAQEEMEIDIATLKFNKELGR